MANSRARTKAMAPPVRVPRRKAAQAPVVAQERRNGTGGVTSAVMRVTPSLAEDWLGKNSHNRPIRNRHVEMLAGAMRRGEWIVNGDAIRFAGDFDTLLDGQHRLWAVVLSETPIETVVMSGLSAESQETLDQGARRNLKDVLALRGINNSATVAAVLNWHWRRMNGYSRGGAKPTIQQALAHLEAWPAIKEAHGPATKLSGRISVSSAVMGSAWVEFSEIDDDGANSFFEQLSTSIGLQPGSPILALRAWLERQAHIGAGARSSAVVTYAMFIKAWNAYRDGKHVEHLTWKTTGVNAEAFPEPR